MLRPDDVIPAGIIAIGILLLLHAALRQVSKRYRDATEIAGFAGATAAPLGGAVATFGVALIPLGSPSDFAAPFEAQAECRAGPPQGLWVAQTAYVFRGAVKQKVGKAFNVVFHARGVQPGPYVIPLTSTSGTDKVTTTDSCGSVVQDTKGQISACASADKNSVTVSWSIAEDKASSPLIRLRIPDQLLPETLIGPDWQCRVSENGRPLQDAAGKALVLGRLAGKVRFGNAHFEADLQTGAVQFNPDITPSGLSAFWDTILDALDTLWGKIVGGVAGAATIVAGIRILWRWYRRRHPAATAPAGEPPPSSPSPRRSGSAGSSARPPSRSG